MPALTCRSLLATLLTALALCAGGQRALADAGVDANPEAASGVTAKALVTARHLMAVTAHPLATDAAYVTLRRGGSAVDAAIAAQMVLTLVEPQSSGIGGGAFLLHFAANDGAVRFFDGRETAPARVNEDLFMRNGRPIPFFDAVNSGKSVGVPGVLRMLELAHRRHGKLPWADLFQPAIAMAEDGFRVTPRLAALIAGNDALARQPAARAYFFRPDGTPLQVGDRLRNPALAATLRTIAAQGADAFYIGALAGRMVDAVASHPVPGTLSRTDLSSYAALEREPVCAPYRQYRVCGAAPPSSGGIAIAQMLGILAHTPIDRLAPDSVDAVHVFSEAGRLAYADRERYVADPAFQPVPVDAMVAPAYLARRAALISPTQSMGRAAPGDPVPGGLVRLGLDDTPELPSTTHLSIVDADGNAVAMTSTIEQAFGSKILVGGFLLNNELTDFSLSPVDAQGRRVANRVEPGKRPRSTMAPTVMMEPSADGRPPRLRLVVGSPGGSAIVNYVAQTIVANLDWKLDIQAAVALAHRGSRNRDTELEAGTGLDSLIPALEKRGHHVTLHEFPSGVHAIAITPDGGLQSGADPRREGTALGH
ncbi:gamma-glutamyltranspeptidase [Pigmentiphaga litoralis]|nr:gamma-glutamyltranspeptidase [Pigmentiphaga litoralis]